MAIANYSLSNKTILTTVNLYVVTLYVKTRSRVLRAGFGSALADSLPIRIRAHPAERFNSVGACTPTEYSLT